MPFSMTQDVKMGRNVIQTSKIVGLVALTASLLLAGCRQDMHNQPKFYPQRGTSFYVDGRSVRPQVENTVSRAQLRSNTYFYTGLSGNKEGDGMPLPVTVELLQRGQEQYNIFCTPCHSRVGNGAGMIVQRGYRPAGNFHTDRLRDAPLGHFYSVIANGYGAMPEYGSQVSPANRWAIVAYIRALQLSQNATEASLPAGQRPQDLHEIANQQGMPPGFADAWQLPNTAVSGTPESLDRALIRLLLERQPMVAQQPHPIPVCAMRAVLPEGLRTRNHQVAWMEPSTKHLLWRFDKDMKFSTRNSAPEVKN